jgi:hypothetical protein
MMAASALLLPLSGTKVFGALSATQAKNLIPAVKLNKTFGG